MNRLFILLNSNLHNQTKSLGNTSLHAVIHIINNRNNLHLVYINDIEENIQILKNENKTQCTHLQWLLGHWAVRFA